MYHQIIQGRRHPRGLRFAGRAAFAALILCCCLFPARGQGYPNGLSADSVDPAADAAFIRQMRVRLDYIRRTERRPTVALVLSGGGAKGAAQVGALKYLEEQGIPIDFICGTSIGGLIGGMYAIGYRSDELKELFTSQDWGLTLSDRIDQRFIPYENKLYRQEYLLTLPFHYSDPVSARSIRSSDRVGARNRENLRLGAPAPDSDVRPESGNFARSLPSGYVFGLNVGELLSSLTVGYHDSISFAALPIPYMCVAADLVSCKAKNWTSGNLNIAMRSTMSIPGLFDPVRVGDLVLVDGGTRNNFPVDIARAVGADYVIGFDLADAEPGYEGINHLGNILSRFVTMLGADAYNRNVGYADVCVKPDLHEFNMLSFNAEAIDVMIQRGYRAIVEKQDSIALIKRAVASARPFPADRKAVDLSREYVLIRSVAFDGLTPDEEQMMLRRTGIVPGQTVDKQVMDDAMSSLIATGAFEAVSYSLYGGDAPYDLVFHCTRGPVHQLGLGFRLDTEQWASMALHLGLNTRKLTGSKLILSTRLGRSIKASARYFYDSPHLPTINLEAGLSAPSADLYLDGAKNGIGCFTHYEQLYFSNIRWTSMDVRLGVRNHHYRISKGTALGKQLAERNPDFVQSGFLGGFADGHLYTFDDKYYPSHGVDLRVGLEGDFVRYGQPAFHPVWVTSLDFKTALPLGGAVAFLPEIHYRSVFGEPYSYLHYNYLGGAIAGRYVDQQIPFAGFGHMMMMRDHLATASLELRLQPASNFFLSLTAGAARDAATFPDLFQNPTPTVLGAAFQAGYNSFLGPLKLSLQWSDLYRWGAYLSLGFDF